MAGSMTPDQQAAFQELLIEVVDGAKIVRYVNLASVSRLSTTHECRGRSFHHLTVALLYIRLDPQHGSGGKKLLTSQPVAHLCSD